MKKRIISLMILAVFMMAASSGAALTVKDEAVEMYGSSVHYPGIEEYAEISGKIVETAEIDKYLTRMPSLASSQEKLHISWEGGEVGGLLSFAFHMEGPLRQNVKDEYVTVNIDTATGENVALEDVLTENERQLLQEFISENVESEMSPHCPVCRMDELPQMFRIVQGAIILYYPMDKVTTLSEKPGKVKAAFSEFLPQGYVMEDNSRLKEFGYGADFTEEDGKALMQCVMEGTLEGIPASLGENVAGFLEKYPLAEDADLIEDGRTLVVDDGELRGVQFVTDRLTETFTSSVVNGIRISSGCVMNLIPGITKRDSVTAAMGESESTVTITEEMAEMNRMEPGISDYYVSGSNRIRLNYTEDGVLTMIWLMW